MNLPWHSGQSAVHLSGAKSVAALAASGEAGAQVAALHPLMTFPHVELDGSAALLLDRLNGCYWALESDAFALSEYLRQLVDALDGHLLILGHESRVPYHMGAVFASNYVVGLLGAACALWETFGIGQEEALQALLPLVHATVDSVKERGIPEALSGPVARGDTGTILTHLDWLEHYQQDARLRPESGAADVSPAAMMESTADAYRALAQLALLLATQKQTVTPEQVASMRALLSRFQPPR
jgi:predicted short-subunit dehydrogenase-like oxidoreductase (DUF2520 family)